MNGRRPGAHRLGTWTALALLLAATSGCSHEAYKSASAMTGGDPERGSQTIARYGCNACHTIPGIPGTRGLVGPPLTQIARRVYLAGRLPNTPGNMLKWIQHPQQIEPGTVMPEMGVGDRDARDIAAYLYTLR